MRKKLLFFVLTISTFLRTYSQWELVEEIELPRKPHVFSNDSQGNLYIGFQDGSLVKYDPLGQELLNYSLSNQSSVTLIDPQFQLKTFLFYFDNQIISILDRFKGVPKNYPIRDYTYGIVSMACPAPDGTFWLVENNPMILRRIDPNRQSIVLETQPDLSNVKFMKAYQNILLILDEKGLNIFDQFGGFLSYLDVKSSHLTVEKDKVYLLSENEILVIEPFTGKILDRKETPNQNQSRLLYSDRYFRFFNNERMLIYKETN